MIKQTKNMLINRCAWRPGWQNDVVAGIVYVLCLAVFFASVWRSDILSPIRRASMSQIAQTAKESRVSMHALCESAENYWSLYPDVAQDAFFGRYGKVGCGGAYEHWTRHGHQEGRVWPGENP